MLRYLSGLVLLAAVACGGFWLLSLLSKSGPEARYSIELLFRSARGLKRGAAVLYRGYRVGDVTGLHLAADGQHAVVEVSLLPEQADTVRTGTRFWIVTPRFSGVAGGASGLETLIKDSYIAYRTPQPGGPAVPAGARLPGSEEPPEELDLDLPPPLPGDLVCEVVLARSHGLQAGARVRHRGITTGEVRRVELSANGRAVMVEARIDRRFRHTLTDTSWVWVARPSVSGSIMAGLAVEELDALLQPYLAYAAPEDRPGQPALDGARFLGLDARPELKAGAPSLEDGRAGSDSSARAPASAEQRLVRVHYQCEHKGWFSDDQVAVSGTGLLFRDGRGRAVVLTARSLVDGSFFLRGAFGRRPSLVREEIRVQLPDGGVQAAGCAWTAPDDRDLALLMLPEESAGRVPAGSEPMLSLSTEESARLRGLIALQAPAQGKAPERHPLPEAAGNPATTGLGDDHRGALLLHEGRIVGLLVRKAAREVELVPLFLGELPPDVRPPVGARR
jgi:hypothetical protein